MYSKPSLHSRVLPWLAADPPPWLAVDPPAACVCVVLQVRPLPDDGQDPGRGGTHHAQPRQVCEGVRGVGCGRGGWSITGWGRGRGLQLEMVVVHCMVAVAVAVAWLQCIACCLWAQASVLSGCLPASYRPQHRRVLLAGGQREVWELGGSISDRRCAGCLAMISGTATTPAANAWLPMHCWLTPRAAPLRSPRRSAAHTDSFQEGPPGGPSGGSADGRRPESAAGVLAGPALSLPCCACCAGQVHCSARVAAAGLARRTAGRHARGSSSPLKCRGNLILIYTQRCAMPAAHTQLSLGTHDASDSFSTANTLSL